MIIVVQIQKTWQSAGYGHYSHIVKCESSMQAIYIYAMIIVAANSKDTRWSL